MSVGIQSGKVTANISGNVSAASFNNRNFLVLEQGAGEDTTVSTNYASPSNTSTLGFWETGTLTLPTGYNAIVLTTTAQKGRLPFQSACTVLGRSIGVMFVPSASSGIITFTVNKIGTDGAVTAIGSLTVDNYPTTLQPLNLAITNNTTFAAGESIELSVSLNTSTINLTQLWFSFSQY